jgi:hypothetical protein
LAAVAQTGEPEIRRVFAGRGPSLNYLAEGRRGSGDDPAFGIANGEDVEVGRIGVRLEQALGQGEVGAAAVGRHIPGQILRAQAEFSLTQ